MPNHVFSFEIPTCRLCEKPVEFCQVSAYSRSGVITYEFKIQCHKREMRVTITSEDIDSFQGDLLSVIINNLSFTPVMEGLS